MHLTIAERVNLPIILIQAEAHATDMVSGIGFAQKVVWDGGDIGGDIGDDVDVDIDGDDDALAERANLPMMVTGAQACAEHFHKVALDGHVHIHHPHVEIMINMIIMMMMMTMCRC